MFKTPPTTELDPFRTPQWRWERAVCLADTDIRLRRTSQDVWLSEAHRLVLALRGCHTDPDRVLLAGAMPDAWSAYEVFERRETAR